MNNFWQLLSLAPISRGFIAMILAGSSFPLCGVMVLQFNLMPLRYMLMHGVILGGAISLALSLPLVPITVVVNLLLVAFLLVVTKNPAHGFTAGSAAAMVVSMAIASLVMHLADVPAKDTMSLLWGSPFSLSQNDIGALVCITFVLLLYLTCNFRTLSALFFNQEVAQSLGIRVRFHLGVMVLLIALVIALAMRLLGALLIDALLVLPVLVASNIQESGQGGLKRLYCKSALCGFCIAICGYSAAILLNVPPSAAIALCAGILYILAIGLKKIRSSQNKERT